MSNVLLSCSTLGNGAFGLYAFAGLLELTLIDCKRVKLKNTISVFVALFDKGTYEWPPTAILVELSLFSIKGYFDKFSISRRIIEV
jgi:hypothetical protein